MAVINGLISFGIHSNNSLATLIFACSLFVCNVTTLNAVHWYYLAETLTDRQFGFVSSAHYSGGIMNALTIEYLMSWLSPQGMFLVLMIFNAVCWMYLLGVCQETFGLSDREKKELYKKPNQLEGAVVPAID